MLEPLSKLKFMAMTKEILEATEIGEVVSGLRKHGSKLIRHLARELVDVWKVIVESC